MTATALSGAVAAMLLLGPEPAKAAEECSAPEGGVVTCTPDGNPYPGGITYLTGEDLVLRLEDGVVVYGNPGGRVRVDGEGDADVSIDISAGASVSGFGFLQSGVEANATDGDVVINARGPITTEGFLAYGIRAVTRDGAISIASGDVSTKGGNGISVGGSGGLVSIDATGHIHSFEGTDVDTTNPVSGMFVFSEGDVRIANSGLVEVDSAPQFIPGATLGLAADGIHVETGGDVAISGAGAITTSGFQSYGISVRGDAIRIEQGSVETEGDGSAAILAFGSGAMAIDVDQVSSAKSDGIVASAAGDIAVDFGSVDAGGSGVYANSSGGAVRVTGGTVTARGQNNAGIDVLAKTNATVDVEGAVSSPNGYGVSIDSQGSAALNIFADGSVTGGVGAVYLASGLGAGAALNNAGTITGGSAYAIAAVGGPATIVNSGTMTGYLALTDGDDSVTSSGTFNPTADSYFGAGADRFVNNGTFNILSAGGQQGGVVLFGLEQFENSGAINLVDGRADGYLELEGDYLGADGLLKLDVKLAGGAPTGADQLILSGAATGRTLVAPTGFDGQNGLLDPGVAIVFAGPGSSPDAFTTGGLNVGFVEYGVIFDDRDDIYFLVSGVGDGAYRSVKYLEGAQNLWYESSDAWSAHLLGPRDGNSDGRLWAQSFGSVDSRREIVDTSFEGATADADLSYRQTYYGGQFGYDLIQSGDAKLGLTAGYLRSAMDFRDSEAGATYDAFNAGVYATWQGGPFFADALGKYDHYRIDAHDGSIGFGEDFGGDAYGVTGQVGLHVGSDRLFLEPLAALSYLRTNLDDFSALSSQFSFETGDGLRGKLGARAGSAFGTTGGANMSIYAGGNAVKEFSGGDGATFSNNGQSIAIENSRIGLYGEAVAGVSFASEAGVSGFFEGFGDFGRTDDLRGGGGRAGLRVTF